ncbi:acyl-coenzyme A diphosphatase NUDT19 [Hyperolius riggenbachi]|uniref:acyl-coenzyme A diphosphatase NUDT19 n=1 Tax=Hyperolius riggenbachi TaxID=752182 RepID=UPI0035A3B76D
MNNTLRHWREAATLILAAGSHHGGSMSIMASQLDQKKKVFDYEVLLLTRSQNSGFMPNALVFPGGVVDASDFSNDWMKIFERHIKKPNFGLGVVKQSHISRPPMFATDRVQFGSLIPGEVAFRICAIRETFEESGILLVVPENLDVDVNQNFIKAYEENEEEVSRWREAVQNNPVQFIEMCKKLQCVPNIWALHEWDNWLTPTFSKNSKARRFDTAFFVCCLPKKPVTKDDQKEVTSFQWATPQETIEKYKSQATWLPPPQFYNLSRLCNFSSIQELHRFSCSRGLEGCERWLPITVHAENGVVHTLPGDALYPEDPDVTGESGRIYSTDKTIEVLMEKGCSFHRFVVYDGVPNYYVNTQPKYRHVNPIFPDIRAEPQSRL